MGIPAAGAGTRILTAHRASLAIPHVGIPGRVAILGLVILAAATLAMAVSTLSVRDRSGAASRGITGAVGVQPRSREDDEPSDHQKRRQPDHRTHRVPLSSTAALSSLPGRDIQLPVRNQARPTWIGWPPARTRSSISGPGGGEPRGVVGDGKRQAPFRGSRPRPSRIASGRRRRPQGRATRVLAFDHVETTACRHTGTLLGFALPGFADRAPQ